MFGLPVAAWTSSWTFVTTSMFSSDIFSSDSCTCTRRQ